MKCKACLNNCYGKGCCYVDYVKVDCILYACRIYLGEIQVNIIKALKWTTKDKIPELLKMRMHINCLFLILKKEWEAQKLGFRSCLCDKDLCNLVNLISDILPLNCKQNCRTDQIYI